MHPHYTIVYVHVCVCEGGGGGGREVGREGFYVATTYLYPHNLILG